MLPLLNLTFSEILPPEALKGAGGLMPEASDALRGGFASVLQSTVHPAVLAPAPAGEDLPPTGNALPVMMPDGELPLHADIEIPIEDIDFAPLGIELPLTGSDTAIVLPTLAAAAGVAPETGDSPEADVGLPVTIHVPPRPVSDGAVNRDLPVPPAAIGGDELADTQPVTPVAPNPATGEPALRPQIRERGGDTVTLRQQPGPVVREQVVDYVRAAPTQDADIGPATRDHAGIDERVSPRPLWRDVVDDAAGPKRTGLSRSVTDSAASIDAIPRAVRDEGLPIPRTVQPSAWQQGMVTAEPAPETGPRIHADLAAAIPRAAAPAPAVTPLPTAALTIDVPVQQPGWDSLLADRVTMMTNGRVQNAELRLTPAELGPLRIRLEIDDGVANVSFQSQHPVTREALEQAMPRLRELLAENGLSLGQADVHDDNSRQRSREARADAGPAIGTDADSGDVDDGTMSHVVRSAADSLVDTFA